METSGHHQQVHKGSPSEITNYRPISLTCTCCKILETIISSDILQFLYSHNLISKSQHGFLKKHSTSTNLLESVHDWTVSLSNCKSVLIGYIDFKRAFDAISHSKRIHKLKSYGLDGNLLLWISSFLTNRFQQVKINSHLSQLLPVLSSVPQGSVLGPLLFNLFINDSPDNFGPDVTIKLFADDLKIYSELNLTWASTNFQTHLDIIQDWSITWQINISYSKCNILHLGNHTPDSNFNLSDNIMFPTPSMRNLGILIEPTLKFKGHIHDIVSKAKQRSAFLFKCFITPNPTRLIRAFKTYVRPLLEYASIVWSPYHINWILEIESVQRNLTKRLPGLKDVAYSERLNNSQLQSLEHRRLINDLIFCYNIVHGLSAIHFSNFFSFTSNPSSRGHSPRITTSIPKSNLDKHFFSYRVVQPWNSLPQSIVSSPNKTTFKSRLLKFNLSKFLILPTLSWSGLQFVKDIVFLVFFLWSRIPVCILFCICCCI